MKIGIIIDFFKISVFRSYVGIQCEDNIATNNMNRLQNATKFFCIRCGIILLVILKLYSFDLRKSKLTCLFEYLSYRFSITQCTTFNITINFSSPHQLFDLRFWYLISVKLVVIDGVFNLIFKLKKISIRYD